MGERKLSKSVFKYLNVKHYFNFLYLFFCWNFLRTIVIWKIHRERVGRSWRYPLLLYKHFRISSFFSILLIWTFCPHTFYEAFFIFIFFYMLCWYLFSLPLQSVEKLQMKLRSEGGIKALLGIVRCGHPDFLSQVARGIPNFAKCESWGSTQGMSLN